MAPIVDRLAETVASAASMLVIAACAPAPVVTLTALVPSVVESDAALAPVSASRSTIGATQNQLNYTVTNLNTAIQNVTASRSNITDADLASEVTQMSQSQILTSAATSVLAQANSAPQAILKLLQ